MRWGMIMFSVFIFVGISIGGVTRIFIWNRVGSDPFFINPETGMSTTPSWEYERYLEKVDSLIMSGTIPAHDTINWVVGDTLSPFITEMYDVIIGLFGWPGSDGPGMTHEDDILLTNFLESNRMEIGQQKAFLVEGNDFARRYCHSASPFEIKNYLCVEYGISTPSPDSIKGVPGTYTEGMRFGYFHTALDDGGPDTTSDDITIFSEPEWSTHAAGNFNMAAKNPARGILRSSYSPGACQLITFCFGNLINASYPNTKTELMKRMLDYAIPPIGQLLEDYTDTILYIDSLYVIKYIHYDNFLVKSLNLKYSTDNGASWNLIYSVGYPADNDTLHPWIVPPTPSDSCYLMIETADEAYNFYADTSGRFRIVNTVDINDGSILPTVNWLSPAYPNPFNAQTVFRATFCDGGAVNIYNLNGRIIRNLFNGKTDRAGTMIRWDGRDDNGAQSPSGLYIITAEAEGWKKTIRVVLTR